MKLITKEIERAFAKQGDTSSMSQDEIKIICKWFDPMGAATWYVYERDAENPEIFWAFVNLGDSEMAECGTVSLSEIQEAHKRLRRLPIERDLHFPIAGKTLSDVINKIKSGGHV